MEVPTQSEPVSPPPITRTFFPFADIISCMGTSPVLNFIASERNSRAKWIPSRPLPPAGRSRGVPAPIATRTASNDLRRYRTEISSPILTSVSKTIPSSRIREILRSIIFLSSLKLGIPIRIRPPISGDFSNTVTRCPSLLNVLAAARPAGPEPITATLFPLSFTGGEGTTHPSSKAFSIMASSISFMETGASFMERVHEVSQRAGHILPVNSGKLLVRLSLLQASFQSSLYTRSFHSGIRFARGQPMEWQKGRPQSIHRAPCLRISSDESLSVNSL